MKSIEVSSDRGEQTVSNVFLADLDRADLHKIPQEILERS